MIKKIVITAAFIAITPLAHSEAKLDEGIRDYGIHEFILPALNLAYPSMSEERHMAVAECQVSTLEKILDTTEKVRSAMGELPMYIEWSEGLTQGEPEIQHEHAVMNAFMQCQ